MPAACSNRAPAKQADGFFAIRASLKLTTHLLLEQTAVLIHGFTRDATNLVRQGPTAAVTYPAVVCILFLAGRQYCQCQGYKSTIQIPEAVGGFGHGGVSESIESPAAR
jgi:hypothetical protein